MPQSAIARGFLAQFSWARQAAVAPQQTAMNLLESALEKQRDQLPLLAPVALGGGIAAWQLGGQELALSFGLTCMGFMMIAAWIGFSSRLARLIAVGALLFATGYATITVKSAVYGAPPIAKPWTGTLNGRIESVEDVSARDIVRYVLRTNTPSVPPLVRINVPLAQHRAGFQSGAVIQAKVRLMPPPGPALPRSYDFARQAWFSGLGATGTALSAPRLLAPSTGGRAFWTEQREALASHIRAAMPGGTGAVGAALLVGTRGAISQDDADALRNSGMAHLLSVSGLHVTAVVGGAFFLISRLLSLFPWFALRFQVPVVAAAASAAVAIGYTLLTGAEVPTVRACVAGLLILAALAMGREPLSLRLLATGACLVLLFWPEALAGPSFQLSFAAVATIIVLHESPLIQRFTARRDEPLHFRLGRAVASLLLTGLAIEMVLAPIALFHFHKSGVYGAFANIIAIPLTTFVIMPAQIGGLLLDSIGLGFPFWWLAGQGVSTIMWMAHSVSNAPGAVLALPSMPRWAFGAAIAGGLWFGIIAGRARFIGLLPVATGVLAMLLAPRPDLLLTGDGRHLAVVDQKGQLVLLRPGAGDYALSTLAENAALQSEPKGIEEWSGARCSPDICSFWLERKGRRWTIMATRSQYSVPAMELAAACKRVDIVISDRYLPWSCKPRWFKADRDFLQRHGGLAIYFDTPQVETVAESNAHHPWSLLNPENVPERTRPGPKMAKP